MYWGSFLRWESLFNNLDLSNSLCEIFTSRVWYLPNFPVGYKVGKHIMSIYCCWLSIRSSLALKNLYCSMSDSVDRLLSRFLIVKAWKPGISCSSALSSIPAKIVQELDHFFSNRGTYNYSKHAQDHRYFLSPAQQLFEHSSSEAGFFISVLIAAKLY